MGSISERNKKVAIARWSKKHFEEKLRIKDDRLLKSAICGFLAGDGSVQVRRERFFIHYQLDFFPDDGEMLKKYIEFIGRVYGRVPKSTKKKGFFTVRLSSKVIVEDLIAIASFGIKNWRIPHGYLIEEKHKKHWMRAFFSAEAYVGPKSIKIQSVNQDGMKEVSNMLSDFGIKHKNYDYHSKKANHSDVSIIVISRKEEKRKYFYDIGFWHQKKTTALKQSLGL